VRNELSSAVIVEEKRVTTGVNADALVDGTDNTPRNNERFAD
jgi:hypothetical protein